jgi:CheY-like chemotaxis protein/MinD-like ATPase involved in chromosome partitioning or flagellar assembly
MAKILVVDDDPDALRLVGYAFQAEGHQVITAPSGAEALAQLNAARPDLVILDVMMPDMSGLEVCQRIRASESGARLPILMLSARGLVADRVAGLKSGADDYLPKPADTGELLARAEALLARASHSAAPNAESLVFIGAKGGVGTTTVAVNVGAQLVRLGKSVCLVEPRPGLGTAAMVLKLRPAHDLADLLTLEPAGITRNAVEDCLITHPSGLRVLAAPLAADKPLEIPAATVEALCAALTPLSDYVIFDLATAWSPANQIVVRRARSTMLVCEPDAVSLRCAKAILATLSNWGVMGGMVGLVLVERPGNPLPLSLTAIRAAVTTSVLCTMPAAPHLYPIAANEGSPIVNLQPQQIASVALKEWEASAFAVRQLAERLNGGQW